MHYLNMGSWPCYVGFTTDQEAFAAEMKRLEVECPFLDRETALATCHRLRNHSALTIIIAARPYRKSRLTKEAYSGLIAHEALHALQYLREDINHGEPLGDEAEAYLMQYIVQECLAQAWETGNEMRTRPAP